MSEPGFTAENVEKALHQLYYDPSPEQKKVAQFWLTKAQRAKEAWNFAWELLQEQRATEVQYFGASALICKISGAWADIPEDNVMNLRDRLLDQILCFSALNGKQIVLTRLCVAFSAFLGHCSVQQVWQTAVSDVIQKFQESGNNSISEEQRCCALLEILTILPEEIQTSTMSKYHNSLVLHVLRAGQSNVIQLLSNIFFNSTAKNIQTKVIKCVSSWILLGVPLNDCEAMLCKILECVKDVELFDASVECLLNTFSSPAVQDYPNTVRNLIPLVVSLRPLFLEAVKDHDAESILGLTKLICSLAENFPKLIIETLQNPLSGEGILHMVMECGSIPLQYPLDEMSSPISFTFWCTLQDEIQALPCDSSVAVRQMLHPYFVQLVHFLLEKAKYPTDGSYTKWNAEEKEQHRIYRVDISDTLMYTIDFLGVNITDLIFVKFQEAMLEFNRNPAKPWHGIESCLFGIDCVVENLSDYEFEIPCLEHLSNILPTIRVDSVQLADTMIYTIGTMTDWLSIHSENLWTLFCMVLHWVRESELAMSAVLTIRRLARECSEHLVSFAPQIMEYIIRLISDGILRENEVTWLMQAVGHLLSSVSSEDCLKYLENLLQSPWQKLEALSNDTAVAPNKNGILHIINIFCNLFSTLDRRKEEKGEVIREAVEQPAVLILKGLHPVFQRILNMWETDGAVVQAICVLYEKTIRSLLEDFSPLLQPLCEMLYSVFQKLPYPCILDLSQQFVLVFGGDECHQNDIVSLLQALSKTVIKVYEEGQISNHPDIGHSFMRFLSCVCRKRFEILKHKSIDQQFLLDLFHCGIKTLEQPDSESATSGSMFIKDFISCRDEHKDVADPVYQKSGSYLALVVLKAIGGSSPRAAMDHFADILFEMSGNNVSLFNTWMNDLISDPNIPSPAVDQAAKGNFIKQLCREMKNKRKYREIVRNFTLLCRGLQGTEYAAATNCS